MNTEYNRVFKTGEPIEVENERPAKLREVVEYHKNHLGYSAQDLARLLAVNVEDVERVYFGRTPIRLVVSN